MTNISNVDIALAITGCSPHLSNLEQDRLMEAGLVCRWGSPQDRAFELQRERGLHFSDLGELALTVHGAEVPDEQAVASIRTMTADQVSELRSLACGKWVGEPDEVAGLRALGLQDDALGTTPLGAAVVRVSWYDFRKRLAIGAEWSWA